MSKGIEWHCKHYCGRGLMKYFASGYDLAKEMGIPAAAFEKTLKVYSEQAKAQKDPFGKSSSRTVTSAWMTTSTSLS